MFSSLPIILQAVALSSLVSASARSVNVTIDDEFGDSTTGERPKYDPPGGWNHGATCGGCLARPDVDKAFRGTWHDTSQHLNDSPHTITISFNGTAVYVYNIIANQIAGIGMLTNLTFVLDGDYVDAYEHSATQSQQYMYHVLVYSNGSLADMEHTLIIQASPAAVSLILFDYVVYTTHEPDSSSSAASPGSMAPITLPESATGEPTHSYTLSSTSVSVHTTETPPETSFASQTRSSSIGAIGAIAGSTIGAIILCILGLLLFLFFRRQRRKRAIQVVSEEHPHRRRRWRAARPPTLPKESEKGSLSVHGTELLLEPSSATRLPVPEGGNGDQAISPSHPQTPLSSETPSSLITEHPKSISPSLDADLHTATVRNASPSHQTELHNAELYTSHDLQKAPIVASDERVSAPAEEPVHALEAETDAVVSQAVQQPGELAASEAAGEAPPAPQTVARNPVSTGSAALHAQLAALQEEVARLREHVDAPPPYV